MIFVMYEQVCIMSIAAISSSICSGDVCHCHLVQGNDQAVSAASCKGLM